MSLRYNGHNHISPNLGGVYRYIRRCELFRGECYRIILRVKESDGFTRSRLDEFEIKY